MKTKKILLLICLIAATITILCGCEGNILKDDSQLRKEGKNIVVSYDCGRYNNTAFDVDKDVEPILYGKVSKDDEHKFQVGRMANYQIRSVYCTEDSKAPQPGQQDVTLSLPAIARRVFDGWYVASVIKWKTGDEQDGFLRNKWGQKVYDYCIPQEDDIKWDFTTMSVGDYETHPFAQVYTLKDYENIDIHNVTADDLVAETDDTLGYNAENGFNIYLYAKWKPVGYFVVMWHSPLTQQWEVIERYNTTTYTVNLRHLVKNDYTYYNVYQDAEYQILWDEKVTFDSFEVEENRPYVKVYAKYLVGNWSVVRTASELNTAVFNNRNVFLDKDIEYSGETANDKWRYSYYYDAEFNGNNHTITFYNECTPALSYKSLGGPAETYLFGLFGEFKGKMYNVTFANVEILVPLALSETIYTGVLIGSVEEGAELTNIAVSGKVSYVESDKWNTYTVYSGVGANGWYGAKKGDTEYDVTFTQID